jgi:hypothetical protein
MLVDPIEEAEARAAFARARASTSEHPEHWLHVAAVWQAIAVVLRQKRQVDAMKPIPQTEG